MAITDYKGPESELTGEISRRRKSEAKAILGQIGMPLRQQNDMCCHVFLALLTVGPQTQWGKADNKWVRIHDIIAFLRDEYGVQYAENSRETIRKEALHRFRTAALIEDNGTATNSPNYRYRITPEALALIRTYRKRTWKKSLLDFIVKHGKLKETYASKRQLSKMAINVNGAEMPLSTGRHNLLQKAVLEEFASRFAQHSKCLYIGDTAKRDLFKDEKVLGKLHFDVTLHDKMPDVILYSETQDWLYFIECVTSVGPMSPQRVIELKTMSKNTSSGRVFITAFPDFRTFKRFADSIAWETEVWIADMPDHMIHLNGDRFMGPR